MLNMDNDKLYCKKKEQSMSSKKRKLKLVYQSAGWQLTDDEVETLLNEKEGYLSDDGGSRRAERTCCSYPIKIVNLLGRAIKLKKLTYILCCYCITLTYLPSKMTNQLQYPNCGMHFKLGAVSITNIKSFADIPKRIDIAYPQLLIFNKIDPTSSLTLNPNNTKINLHPNIDSPIIYHNISRTCFYCSQRVKEDEMKLIYIVDDTKNFSIYPHILCKRDYNYSYTYRKFNPHNVFLKTNLLNTISKYRERSLAKRMGYFYN